MDANQLWVRNAEGKVWGPLPPKQVLLLLERKLISGITEASRDGRRYSPASEEPILAEAMKASLTPGSRGRTVSGSHEVWRPPSGSFPIAGGKPTPAPSSVSAPGRAPTPAMPIPTAAPSHRPVASPSSVAPPAPSTAPKLIRTTVPEPPAPAVHPPPAPAPAPAHAAPPMPAKIIQAVPPSGRLEEHSPLKLYYLIAAAETQGKLVLGEGFSAISVWFKAGTPHAIESFTLGLGEYLIEQRVLTPAQLASAEPHIRKAGGDVASGLFAAALLNPQTAFPLIQQHAQTLLQRGLLLDHGPFEFDPSIAVPASGFQLGQRWQLLSAAARRIDPLRLRSWLHGREQLVPQLVGSTAELQLTAQETRLLGHLDGTHTLAEAMAAAGALSESLERLVLLLSEIDRLTLSGASAPAPSGPSHPAPARHLTPQHTAVSPPPRTGPQTPMPASVSRPPPSIAPVDASFPPPSPKTAPGLSGAIAKAMAQNAAAKAPSAPSAPAAAPPAAAKPASPPPAAKPVAPPVARPAPAASKPAPAAPAKPGTPLKIGPGQGANVNLPALVKFLEDLRKKDYFARLKVDRGRGPIPMLKSNFFQFAKLYHPDTVPPDGPEEARRVKADILSLLNEANAVLSDEAKRVNYLEELEAKESLGDVDVEAVLMAEEDFQQAIVFARARKFADALALIEKCVKANPKEGEFYAWRGYCRFFGSQDKRTFREMAIEDQQKALQLNPKCSVAWLFQGQIWKLLEDIPKAKEAFQKTLEMDPNNIEAQRELRLFEQRKK